MVNVVKPALLQTLEGEFDAFSLTLPWQEGKTAPLILYYSEKNYDKSSFTH